MPLNQEYGEILKAYGPVFDKVPVQKWADTPMYDEAYKNALAAFRKKVRGTVRFDPETEISVQEYHHLNNLVFIFHKQINGVDFYHVVPILFPEEQIEHLILTNRWPRFGALH